MCIEEQQHKHSKEYFGSGFRKIKDVFTYNICTIVDLLQNASHLHIYYYWKVDIYVIYWYLIL